MAYFHYRCGERITLINDNCTAIRNDSDFDHGMVITAEPLVNDVLFEIKIDRKVNSWSGSLEIGVVDCDPLHFDIPPCATKIQDSSWIMSGSSVFKNGICLVEGYGTDLDKLNQDDRVGLMRTSEGDLIFYMNGESQGVAAEGLPEPLYAVIDLYGKCVQVSITSPALREHNNDDCLSGSSVLAIENDILNVTLGGDLSELSLSSSNSLDIRMDMNVSLSLPEESARVDKLRFHDRCGSLVKLSNNNRTAERRRPLDEFNNGVVITHRPLRDLELFEIRIDRLVDKWSGSIEVGITAHNPTTLVFPATMTNMRSGTIMMSGCGILTNGKGTRREYGDFNLDELTEGDRVGMMKKPNGDLHYFINGLDQGVAAQRVPSIAWGVIDLYGMTIKVSIVERDEREEQNLITRKNARDQHITLLDPQPVQEYYDRLRFHENCSQHAQIVNNGRTAKRPAAEEDFNNAILLTSRALKTNELFEVRVDKIKWGSSIEIGVTTHSPLELDFPFTMNNVKSGTWMMTGSGVTQNGKVILDHYGINLDRLQVGDMIGVLRKENGFLHFFINHIDQGTAACNIPEKVYGVIDLYGQAVEVTIFDFYDYASPDTVHSSLSNTTLYSDLRFHHIHGKNIRIVNNGLTAVRPRPFAEFNDAIVFSNRPLRDGELFEVTLDKLVDRWSGCIELGVTAVRPDDVELPNTATDLFRDTWMLSGSSIMENGKTINNKYPLDLDSVTAGTRIGVMKLADKTLGYFRDGVPQGIACIVPHVNVYAVVDLYGQCAQVSIPCTSPVAPLASAGLETCTRSEYSLQATTVGQSQIESDLHRFSEFHGNGVILSEGGRTCTRMKEANSCVVYSATPLIQDEIFEVSICNLMSHLAGTLCIGVTTVSPATCTNNLPNDCCYLTANELRYKNRLLQLFTPNLQWLNTGDRIGFIRPQDGPVKVFINGEELALSTPSLPSCLYVVIDLRGSCSSVSIISQKSSILPLNGMRLQDSLELVIDPEPASLSDNRDSSSQETASSSTIVYEFHDNHGRNIELFNKRTSAKRTAGYNQGILIVQQPLEPGTLVQVVVEHVELQWQSSLIVGLIASYPDRLNLPVNALSLKGPCCIVANDWISVNGVKSRSTYGQSLTSLSVGDTVGVILTDTRQFKLALNNVEYEGITWTFPIGHPIYAVFDLYGQCQQVRIVNNVVDDKAPATSIECEKGDLELGEKEQSESKLSLPIPSASIATPSLSLPKNSPITPFNPLTCTYRDECDKFKKRLLLPDNFFTSDLPKCYCNNCYKVRSQSEGKDNPFQGWVKYPLRMTENMPTDKWHNAFYPAKVSTVRCILDKGQPLTRDQMQYSNLVSQKEDDLQILFYPSLENCLTMGYKTENKEVHIAFQILVKPGAYSISRDTVEWSTKETGAIILEALLVHIRPL